MEDKKFRIVERAVTGLLIMLLAEFVLGAFLTTVIDYNASKHSGIQTTVLVAHIVIGIALIVSSFAHILTSRHSHLLGPKPILGFMLIVGAFVSGGFATQNGNNVAVLLMALFFAAAITTYGVSYAQVKAALGAEKGTSK